MKNVCHSTLKCGVCKDTHFCDAKNRKLFFSIKTQTKMEKTKIIPYKKQIEGTILKITKPVAIIKFERLKFFPKYERFTKKTSKIHARIPAELIGKLNLNDQVIIAECRPLSKTVRHIVVSVKNKENKENK
jgi:small subunit ribosomal protein S17